MVGRVFGSGAQIKVNGSEKITLGGQTTDNYGQKNTYNTGQSTTSFNLKIKQEQQVNLEGIIGERLHVLIDYNSEVMTDKKSKIRLYYEGKEDEILQRLEAGDTEFSLTGSSRIGGLTTQHKGLFGIKGIAKLGGLELTAIASKDEGQYTDSKFVGRSKTTDITLDDKQFISHRFFTIPAPSGDSIIDLRVFVNSANQPQTGNYYNLKAVNRSWVDFLGTSRVDTVGIFNFLEKTPIEDYRFEKTSGPYMLVMRYGLQNDDNLAVAYKTAKGFYYPDSSVFSAVQSDKHVALLKPSNCQPSGREPDGYAWNYEFRNFYDLRSTNIVESSLDIKIKRITGSSQNDYTYIDEKGKTFAEVLGIKSSDGRLDAQYYRLADGYFYFYEPRPFDFDSLTARNPAIYDSINLNNITAQYQIEISYLTNEAVYVLDVPGKLIEGSVTATIGGETVSPSQFVVDYEMNTVTFSEAYRQKIMQPGVEININYQFLPWASLGSKTLVGLRGLYKFNENTQLGGTWLYRSEQGLEDKPRLGEEPRRMIVAGLDGFYKASPAFMTKMVNGLPWLETEEPSNVELSGEFAANFPNPNTKGEVYVDDMEGTKLTESLNMSRQAWYHSSVPVGKNAQLLAKKMFWYNPTNRVLQKEINPNLTDETQQNEPVTTLKFHLEPTISSSSNDKSWGGITQLLSKNGIDLSQSRLINVWVRSSAAAKLHIDIGKEISLDQLRRDAQGRLRGRPDTVDAEPLDNGGFQLYSDETDIGLDSYAKADTSTVHYSDDGNDDYANDSTHCNGTEGNGLYDTEDLKLNGSKPGQVWIQKNNYYSFTFDLAGGDTNQYGWRKFAIPLDSADTVGYPYGWGNVYYARIWVDSCGSTSMDVELALAEITGNRWQEKPIKVVSDSLPVDDTEELKITVINNKDDADYVPPPNAVENDENGHPKFEQSLVFNVKSLKAGHMAFAQRLTNTRENNYTNYKKLRLWVHGPSNAGAFTMKLATTGDTNSAYYQYTGQLSVGWQELVLDLEDFSNLKKLAAESSGVIGRGPYSVKGSPSLANVGAVILGVLNTDTLVDYSGEVWFDNLRLDEVRKDNGSVLVTSLKLGLADIATVNLSYSRIGAYWYTIDQSLPTNPVQSIGYNINGKVDLEKLILSKWGWSSSLNFRNEVVESYPWYGGDDIRLTESESESLMSWSRSRGYSLDFRKRPSQWWLWNFTIDRMSATMNWGRTASNTIKDFDSLTTLATALNWGWIAPSKRYLRLAKFAKFYYYPSSLSFAVNNAQTWHWHLYKDQNVVNTDGSGLTRTGSASLGWQIIDPLNFNYTTNRNMLQNKAAGEWARKLGLGSEMARTQSVDYHATISWLRVIQPSIIYNTSYNENRRIAADSIRSIFDVSNSNNLSLKGDLEVGKWLSKLTSLRNKAKDDSAETGSPRWILINLEKILLKSGSVDISFTQSKSNGSSYLTGRPGLWYQLGWYRKPGDIGRYEQLGTDRASITNNYSAGTGTGIGQFSINGNWSRSDAWNWDASSATFSQTTTWPDLRASVNSVEKFFKKIRPLASASITSNYSRRKTKASQEGRGDTRLGTDNSFSPMISLSTRWKKQINAQASLDYSTTESLLPATDIVKFPNRWEKDWSRSLKITTSASYAFSAPQGFVLKVWKVGKKRVKFKSDLNLGLQASYSNTVTQENMDKEADPNSDYYSSARTEISLTPNASYNFSRNIKGELSGSYTDRWDDKVSTYNSRSYSLQANVTINF
jgi:hypothetical protein